jgi:uncharacterized damage-inducible protein DinB
MDLTVRLNDLLDYTEWERDTWKAWFAEQGDKALNTSMGGNGDGRFSTVTDIVRHIFSAERRYVDRLSGRPITDPATIPAEFPAVFAFGRQSRTDLRELVATFLVDRWDTPEEHKILTSTLRLTPRKVVLHVVMHEIRHWAQIATVLRMSGMKGAFHDVLFSPILGGDPRAKA